MYLFKLEKLEKGLFFLRIVNLQFSRCICSFSSASNMWLGHTFCAKHCSAFAVKEIETSRKFPESLLKKQFFVSNYTKPH